MTWDQNVYYDPEKFGLKIVLIVDEDLGYEFNTFIVWTDGERFYTASDSGCSCSSPFEYMTIDDLRVCSAYELHGRLDDWARDTYYLSPGVLADAHAKISELTPLRAAA